MLSSPIPGRMRDRSGMFIIRVGRYREAHEGHRRSQFQA